jgi:hypothetical protein
MKSFSLILEQAAPPALTGVEVFLIFGTCIASLAGASFTFPGTSLSRIWSLNPHAYAKLAASLPHKSWPVSSTYFPAGSLKALPRRVHPPQDDHDDAASALHVLQCSLSRDIHASNIDVEHAVHFFQGRFLKRFRNGRAGVVHEHIQSAKRRANLRCKCRVRASRPDV